jgi:hypothetical protein
MTEGSGFADAVGRFSTELDAAVVRARRVAAEARETSAKFRRETRQLAEQVQSGEHKATPDALTEDGLRRAAAGFRTDNGLPVTALPDGRQLLAQQSPELVAAPQPVTPSPIRVAGSGRRIPPPSDDDEDFSQERIMR